MTLKAMTQFAQKWQAILRLQEWDIKYRWMTKAEQTSEEFEYCNGFCQWNAQHKTALVVIGRKCESIPFTVIHELLHIRLEGHKEMTIGPTDIMQEVTINAITAAFMSIVPELLPELTLLKQINDF